MFNQPIQYNFNLIKPEPMDNMQPYGGGITGGTSPLYPGATTSPIPAASLHSRPRLSPRRTPSPMDCIAYNIPSMPNAQQNLQIPFMGSPNAQSILHSPGGSDLPLVYQQMPAPMVLNRVTDQSGLGLQPLNNQEGVTNVLDLDNQQYSFDMSLNQLDSAELAVFGTALSENLSNSLLISNPGRAEPVRENAANIGEGSSMTDSFTRLTNNTIQELYTINSIYKPTADNNN